MFQNLLQVSGVGVDCPPSNKATILQLRNLKGLLVKESKHGLIMLSDGKEEQMRKL